MAVNFPFTNFYHFIHALNVFINSRQTPLAYQWRDCRHTFSQHVIRILIAFALLSILFDGKAYEKNVLFTHMEQKQIIMRYIECVLKLFGAFDRWTQKWNRTRKNENRVEQKFVSLIFFPPICYIEFCFFLLSLLDSTRLSETQRDSTRLQTPTTSSWVLLGE